MCSLFMILQGLMSQSLEHRIGTSNRQTHSDLTEAQA